MNEDRFRVVYLLGAGVSIPAGLPDITKLTSEFFETYGESDHGKTMNDLREIAKEYYKRDDIESFLSLSQKLKDPNDLEMFKKTHSSIHDLTTNTLTKIIQITQSYIREKLEKEPNIGYLDHLKYLDYTPDIFTLNYDSIVENVWEKGEISYTDGFTPYWDPSAFENDKIQFRLYKLHGSLYWFTTDEGKLMKILVTGLDTSKMKYVTGENLSEVLIYPTIQKEKFSAIYNYLDYTFIRKLGNSDLCVIIGYSFRDKDITNKIIESVRRNKKLWIVLANPDANTLVEFLKEDLNEEQKLRIISKNVKIQDFLHDAGLSVFLEDLRQNINRERGLWEKVMPYSLGQLAASDYHEGEWSTVLLKYKGLGLLERSIFIVKQLEAKKKVSPQRLSVLSGPLYV